MDHARGWHAYRKFATGKKTPPIPLPAWEVSFTLADEVDGWNERSAALVSSKPALATGFAFGRLDRFDCFA